MQVGCVGVGGCAVDLREVVGLVIWCGDGVVLDAEACMVAVDMEGYG